MKLCLVPHEEMGTEGGGEKENGAGGGGWWKDKRGRQSENVRQKGRDKRQRRERKERTEKQETKVVSTTDVKTIHDWKCMETYCNGMRSGHRTGTHTHMSTPTHTRTIMNTHTHVQYLCRHTLAGAVLQKEPHHLKVILLGSHVQRSEAILHTACTKTHLQTCYSRLRLNFAECNVKCASVP